jgi:DNA-binding transcriptional MerR regulator
MPWSTARFRSRYCETTAGVALTPAARFRFGPVLIGELAEQAATSPRTLRYYESRGLVRPRRSANGYRFYDETELRVVTEIRALLAPGFDLGDIRPFVACMRAGNSSGNVCPDSGVDFATRGRRADEAIDVLRLLWGGGEEGVGFHGEFFDFDGLCSFPKPSGVTHLPIHVGGSSRASARRAGRRGRRLIPRRHAGPGRAEPSAGPGTRRGRGGRPGPRRARVHQMGLDVPDPGTGRGAGSGRGDPARRRWRGGGVDRLR